ncbi:MAG: hypothetical protein HQK93_00630, partial [Nitrospirae bacterium]|nr:hypothetical protein [Nitrospirota bacterium]
MKSSFLSDRICIIFISFVTLGVYYPLIFAQVCNVDDQRMLNYLMSIETFDLKSIFFLKLVYYYRPLLYLTYMFDRFAWLCFESFMHLENIIIHLINGLLVFLCSKELEKRFKIDPSYLTPLIISLLFVLHPINTESICWISGRSDLIAATFIYLVIYLLLKNGLKDKSNIMLMSISYLLALLCKETAVGLLPVILIFIFLIDNNQTFHSLKNRLILMIPFVLTTSFYLLLRSYAINRDVGIRIFSGIQRHPELASNDLTTSNINIIEAIGFYIK